MHHPVTASRALTLAALLPLLLGIAACGSSSDKGSSSPKAEDKTCGALPTSDPTAKLPPGFPAVDGQVLFEPSLQGKTAIVFGLVDQSGFVAFRDAYADQLKAAGWTIDGTDQESVEAEISFSKSPPLIAGTVKVEPLCKGHLTVRYKLSS